jgi:DNA-binding response OmpR family regulator
VRAVILEKSVLIVEDETEIRELLAHYLRKEGFVPFLAADGDEGFREAKARRPDLVILDILLPRVDGLELLRMIRADGVIGRTPVLMLTAKGDETDRVVGLELGADDYLAKPFSPREVVARIKAILRRSAAPPSAEEEGRVYERGGLRLDTGRHEVLVEGRAVPLTAREFRILETFLASPGRVLSREAILRRAWEDGTHVTDRTVDVHLAKMRQKIPLLAEAIETVKDVGYRLRDE